jgi:hypothetical protein
MTREEDLKRDLINFAHSLDVAFSTNESLALMDLNLRIRFTEMLNLRGKNDNEVCRWDEIFTIVKRKFEEDFYGIEAQTQAKEMREEEKI